ncbi:hypothetical protein [Rubrivirga sp.]|uniref:hypothetical protein n=1 Tax=Rubrivirga sp. TaxID=1885344 RepID=UPI003C74EDB8
MILRALLALLVAAPVAAQTPLRDSVWVRPGLEDGVTFWADSSGVEVLGVTAVALDATAPDGARRLLDLEARLTASGLAVVRDSALERVGSAVRVVPLLLGAFASGSLEAGPFAVHVRASLSEPDSEFVTVRVPLSPGHDLDDQRRRDLALLHVALPGVPVFEGAAVLEVDLPYLRDVVALRRSSAVLRRGDLEVVSAHGRAVAFSRTLDGEGWVAAFNAGDEPAFLALEGERAPMPLWPVMASRPDVDVPGLVALFDDDGAVYGLRVPPRATVVYRPVAPDDVRPRGLDE